MGRPKVKVTVTPKKGNPRSPVARFPVTVTKNTHPSGKKLYETKAQLNVHLNRGQRPKTLRLKKSD